MVSLALLEPTLYMTTAEAFRLATFRIFSLYVQFPAATNATQAVLRGTGGNLTFGSHACLSCRRDGTRTRPRASFLGECSPYRPHSVFSVLISDVTGSRYVMLTKAVYHSSFSATVKSRHSKWTKQNDSSHVERARLRQARMSDGAIVGLAGDGRRVSDELLKSGSKSALKTGLKEHLPPQPGPGTSPVTVCCLRAGAHYSAPPAAEDDAVCCCSPSAVSRPRCGLARSTRDRGVVKEGDAHCVASGGNETS